MKNCVIIDDPRKRERQEVPSCVANMDSIKEEVSFTGGRSP